MNTRVSLGEPLERPVRLGVLISGGGTTLVNLIEKIQDGALDAEIAVVLTDRDGIAGIERARSAGLECVVLPRDEYDGPAPFSDAAFASCRQAQVDLVILAGFLSLVEVPDDFRLKVMNIHPALIPAFCGKGYYGHHVHEAVLERGARISGCTVHFADNEYDHGPIILQRVVSVENDDTPESLAARVFEAECDAYPEAIRLFASGRLQLVDQRLHVLAD